MGTFLLALMVVGFLMVAMSIGVILGRKPITGTCGGLGAAGITGPCEICGGNTSKCEEENGKGADGNPDNNLAYNAMDEDGDRNYTKA